MSDPFLGEIKMFGGNFAPRNYAFCNGTKLNIAQNNALFAILGKTFGGDGITTFCLPDFMGRSPVHWGQGAGLQPVVLGESEGTETVTLLSSNLPANASALVASTAEGNSNIPLAGGYLAAAVDKDLIPVNLYTNTLTSPVALHPTTSSGGSVPVAIRNPYLAVSFIIAQVGEFPMRND